jgi:hypothetical protein
LRKKTPDRRHFRAFVAIADAYAFDEVLAHPCLKSYPHFRNTLKSNQRPGDGIATTPQMFPGTWAHRPTDMSEDSNGNTTSDRPLSTANQPVGSVL